MARNTSTTHNGITYAAKIPHDARVVSASDEHVAGAWAEGGAA